MYKSVNLDMTRYRGLSTDTKPDADFGSTFHEMDTGDVYRFDGSEWQKCGSLSGTDPSIYMSMWGARGNTRRLWGLKALASGHDTGVLKTVTGNPISVTDAIATRAKALTVAVSPVQGGTGDPSPDNIRPITGRDSVTVTRTGKNLFDLRMFAEEYPDYCTYDESAGELTVSSDAILFYTGVSVNIPLDASDGGYLQYDVKNNADASNFRFRVFYEDGTFYELPGIGSQTGFVHVANSLNSKKIISIRMNWSRVGTFTIKNFCITQGTTATDYEPYDGQQVTIQLGQTVYGGTLDVVSGKLTVDRAMVDLGTLTWEVANATANIFQTDSLTDMQIPSVRNAEGIICSALKLSATTSLNTDMDDYAMLRATNLARLYVRDTSYSDAASFKTAMNGVQLCYELAEPQTLTLTPQSLALLKGSNTLWTDGDALTLTYKAN